MKIALPSPIQNLVDIVSWQVGPEVFPKSILLLGISLSTYAFVVFLRNIMDYTFIKAVGIGVGSALVLGAVTILCARISGYHERLTQTLTALALGGAIVLFVTTFLRFFLVVSYQMQGLPEINVMELANFLLFPLFVWNVFVFAALYRRSFRASVPIAFGISIALLLALDFWVPAAFKFA
jgi:xanthine/uracil permease